MARAIGAWQYLAFGVLWLIVGAMVIEQTVANPTQLGASSIPSLGGAALLFGVGTYWLWKYPKVRQKEGEARLSPAGTK